MIYTLSKDFTKITETTGTIQNTSQIYTLEMSQSNVKDSGIFIYPLQSKSFSNKDIYLRAIDGAAEARVIPFEVGAEGGDISLSDNAFQDISLANGTVAFLNGAGQVVKYFNLPEEIFLRTIGTTFVPNFTWSALAYPNSTNPNLNGKHVLVLHIKGDSLDTPYEDWGFVNLEDLIDLYVPKDASIAIANNSISAAISAASGNLLQLKNDGLFAGDEPTTTVADWSAVLQSSLANNNSNLADFSAVLQQSFGFSSGGN